MATMGRFDQFIEDGDEDFQSYVERFDHFLKASQVSDDLKVSVFITAIGKKAYKTLKTLLEPEKPENKTYEQLVQTLQEQYVPKTSVIAEWFKFIRRFQQDGETVAAFAVELKRLATSCDFGAFLDEALRDRPYAGSVSNEAPPFLYWSLQARSHPKTLLPRDNGMPVHAKTPHRRPLCKNLHPLKVLRLFDAVLAQGNPPDWYRP
ncbi:hypothetical protein MTO96_025611 [Rhipicephalus appendiculatus]